ncbi:SRPBCC family protein [Actinoplanes sp. NPDC051851]|uniref:SRPBCC family protein n=1 Tax=Actinoplanes sp. NPDC051851 TaxID=3154753 RepID=UPI003424330F
MIDVKHQISRVNRATGGADRATGGATGGDGEYRVLTISQVYDTDLEDLWDVVTTPERIARWFLPIAGELREGGKYQFEGQAGGTITRCAAPREFAATWEFGEQVSWITVRLTPEGDERTRFELEHTAPVDDHWERFGPGAVGIGWDMGLIGLSLYVADPTAAKDPAAVMAWTTSEDGKLFMRLSGDAWAEADIAAGAEPEKARAQAANTYAAYTGAEA